MDGRARLLSVLAASPYRYTERVNERDLVLHSTAEHLSDVGADPSHLEHAASPLISSQTR